MGVGARRPGRRRHPQRHPGGQRRRRRRGRQAAPEGRGRRQARRRGVLLVLPAGGARAPGLGGRRCPRRPLPPDPGRGAPAGAIQPGCAVRAAPPGGWAGADGERRPACGARRRRGPRGRRGRRGRRDAAGLGPRARAAPAGLLRGARDPGDEPRAPTTGAAEGATAAEAGPGAGEEEQAGGGDACPRDPGRGQPADGDHQRGRRPEKRRRQTAPHALHAHVPGGGAVQDPRRAGGPGGAASRQPPPRRAHPGAAGQARPPEEHPAGAGVGAGRRPHVVGGLGRPGAADGTSAQPESDPDEFSDSDSESRQRESAATPGAQSRSPSQRDTLGSNPNVRGTCRALYQYDANLYDELNINPGEYRTY